MNNVLVSIPSFLPAQSGIRISWLKKANYRTLVEAEIGAFSVKKSDRWKELSKCVSGR